MNLKKVFIICFLITFATSVFAQSSNRLGSSNNLSPSGAPDVAPRGPGVNVVVDGDFESGTPSAGWIEASTNFGTPICNVATCGMGGGTGPNNGAFWAWFGGVAGVEAGSVSQDVTIPSGNAQLEFFLEIPIACDNVTDFMEAQIDGMTVFRVQGDDPLCGVVGYSFQSVDVSAFADGGVHTLAFVSEITAANGAGSNFFVDDIALLSLAGAADVDVSLEITNDAIPPVGLGDTFNFILTASNAGPDTATNVMVTDTLSANVTINSTDCGAAIAGNVVTWNIGTLAATANALCNVNVTVNAVGVISSNGTITTDDTDTVPGNNAGNNTVAGAPGGAVQSVPTLSFAGIVALIIGFAVMIVVYRRRQNLNW